MSAREAFATRDRAVAERIIVVEPLAISACQDMGTPVFQHGQAPAHKPCRGAGRRMKRAREP